ncbi:putative reverse transcriptase domain-containing protein [Tanacetum coccineum]
MAPKRRTTRLNPDATPTPVTNTHTTTSVTNAQIQAMINEGVTAALAARDATRNGDDSHTSGTGVRKACAGLLDAIEFATELMDKKINTWAERQADNKRKSDDTARNNQNQQPNKRQNTGRAYAAGNDDRRPYGGPRPLCSKCNYHHDGPCAPKCSKCNRFGHLGRDCRSPPNVNTGANQRACFKCGAQGHFRKDCPKWKNNNNRGNQAGHAKAQAKVYAVGNAGANPDNNVVTGTFLLNNRYASILFDTGADRSFVSTAFSSRIVITPTALDHDYNVELAETLLSGVVKMDDPNITMEEYIRLEEEKARRHGKVYNWETTTYGKIWDNEDVHDLGSVETEFPAIVFNETLTSEATLSCETTISSLNNDEIDFRISFDESDDEDCTPTVSYFNDLDYFNDFENEFPAIVYNDALTSKSDFLTEPNLSPQYNTSCFRSLYDIM